MNPTKRFDSLQERLQKKGLERVLPTEEEWKKQVGDFLSDLEERAERRILTQEDFNLALSKARELNILGLLSPEEFQRLKNQEEERRREGRRVVSTLIESIPSESEDDQKKMYYTFKFYADERLKREGISYFTLARQVFEQLTELRDQVGKFEILEKERIQQKEGDEMWREEVAKYFFQEREPLTVRGQYGRDDYRTDLEKAKELGIITEKTWDEMDKIIKEALDRGEKPPHFIEFHDRQPLQKGGRPQMISRFFVYSGSPVSGLEQEVFEALRGRFFKAMLTREKTEAERLKAKEIKKARREFGFKKEEEGVVPSKLSFREQLEIIKKKIEKTPPLEKVEEDLLTEQQRPGEKIETKKAKVERKKARQELIKQLKEKFGFTEEDVKTMRDLIDTKQIEELKKILAEKNVSEEIKKKIFEVWGIEE